MSAPQNNVGNDTYLNDGKSTLDAEIEALQLVHQRLDHNFSLAVSAILGSSGKVVLSGVGKPYFIAQKISASMASTGTESITIHPVDALHGDMGRIKTGDVLILLSNSGGSPEVVELARAVQHLSITKIAITSDATSPLAKLCDIAICTGQLSEACPMGVAPSTTTTAMLAIGDALTLTLLKHNSFSLDDFAKLHPGGSLGRRLRTVDSAMRPLADTPTVLTTATVLATLGEINSKRAGAACIVDSDGDLLGIFTDGDLRRLLSDSPQSLQQPVGDFMSTKPNHLTLGHSLEDALQLMREHHIDELPVVNENGQLRGLVDIQDIP